MEITERLSNFLEWVKGRATVVKTSIPIPKDRVFDSGVFPDRLEPKKAYFKVVINEMFLARSRQFTELFDPMAMVVSEFTYGGKQTTVPYVVGPSALAKEIKELPIGMSITDTQVAGIHPYMGGKFALTFILARVKRDSYSKRVLQVVEDVSKAFPMGAALQPHLKIAGALMDGIDTLFGMGDTVPIIGHRFEYDHGRTLWLQPGFYALVNEDEEAARQRGLCVRSARLREGRDEDAPAFRKTDFMLYSLQAFAPREDTAELPFDAKFNASVLPDAASIDEGAWDRAKAELLTLHKEILASSDLTWDQAQQLCAEYKAKALQVHKNAEEFRVLKGDTRTRALPSTYEIGTFRDTDAEVRRREVAGLHNLLKMAPDA